MDLEFKKPNFFIIGAAKAGTTSLFDILRQHPQVYFPFDKEPAFFCNDGYYKKGEEWDLNTFFRQTHHKPLRGEATSRYLYFAEKVAPRIKRFSLPASPSFIAIFRDPAKLVYSYYWNSVREGHEDLPFKDALIAEKNRMAKYQVQLENKGLIRFAYSKIGLYAQQVEKYLNYYPKDKFLFLLNEDLSDFSPLAHQLQDFLGLDDHFTQLSPKKSNPTALPKNSNLHNWLRKNSKIKNLLKPLLPYRLRYKLKENILESNLRVIIPPDLDDETTNFIRTLYSEEIKRLQEIICRDLSKWLPG